VIAPLAGPDPSPSPLHTHTLTGILTALAAFIVNLSVENISGLKFGLTLAIMERYG
jgi:hypothetical protein